MQAAVQNGAVIQIRADDNLRVHGNAGRCKVVHDFIAVACEAVAAHLPPDVRVCCMDGDVDRADAHLLDFCKVLGGQIRQRDVVAHEERHTHVVILKIKAVAHAAGQLVDEAEDAFVMTARLLVHEIGLKIEAERPVAAVDDADRPIGSIRLLQIQR